MAYACLAKAGANDFTPRGKATLRCPGVGCGSNVQRSRPHSGAPGMRCWSTLPATAMKSLELIHEREATRRGVAPPLRPAGIARPLFLGHTLRGHVDLDGPALRVRGEGQAERRFPLDRLSRVFANARLNWSGDALRACLERAIPVVIVSADGTPLGSLQPTRLRPSRLTEALEELLEWPNWRDIYLCWLRAARMRVLANWRRAQQAAGAAPEERDYHELVKRHVYVGEPASPMHGITELWRVAVYAWQRRRSSAGVYPP